MNWNIIAETREKIHKEAQEKYGDLIACFYCGCYQNCGYREVSNICDNLKEKQSAF